MALFVDLRVASVLGICECHVVGIASCGARLKGKEALFALSYIENALTSNLVLAPLTTRDPADVGKLVRLAAGEEVPLDQLSHGYSSVEIGEILARPSPRAPSTTYSSSPSCAVV